MRLSAVLLAASILGRAVSATAAPSATQILTENYAASGGAAWNGKAVLKLDVKLSGMGLSGHATSISDLRDGRNVDTYTMGPAAGADGFDGSHAWSKDTSGEVKLQTGGDAHALAVNNAYRSANLWWQPNFGGALVVNGGVKTDHGETADALTITPNGGEPFDAWFDTKSHLLVRTVEKQGPQTVITSYSDYKPIDGSQVPGASTVDSGAGAKYLQTLILTSAQFLPPQPASTYAMPDVTANDFTILGDAKRTEIPFRLLNNHIYADAQIDGKGTFQFIFDTGGQNILTPATAQKLGMKVEGNMPGMGVGDKAQDVGLTHVQSVQIGSAVLKNQIFGVLDFEPNAVEGVTEQGMIGFAVFKRFVARIDYGAKTLVLLEPSAFDPADAGTPVPFVFDGDIPEVKGSFEGIPGQFDIDTGSRLGLTLTGPFVAANDLRAKHPKGADVVDGWGVGGASSAYVTRGKVMTIGSMTISNIVTGFATQKKGAFSSASYQGNVGAGILKRFIVTFDYGHQIMYLKPIKGHVDDLDTFDRSGMWINEAPGGFEVMDVTADGPAARAGLKTGDILTTVDGKRASATPVYAMRQMLRDQNAGTVVTFNVTTVSGSRRAVVTLRDQI